MITVKGGPDKRMATLSNGSCTYYAAAPACIPGQANT